MRLTGEDTLILAGQKGEAARRALAMQIEVGDFFQAEQFVPVSSAHVMADSEALGEPGIRFLEELAELGARCAVPTTINPRGADFLHYQLLGQSDEVVAREQRIVAAFEKLGALPVNTCINYESITPPRFGEHLAWGDTGTVIFANSVAGARSNFEGGPVALAAAITGRTPAYGFHHDAQRKATVTVEVRATPREPSGWGAIGCWIGRRVQDYWQVPALTGLDTRPSIVDLKHLGAALASYGSLAMFHLVGVTPEAPTLAAAGGGVEPTERMVMPPDGIDAVYRSFPSERETPDLVVFSAPQLSLLELRRLAELLASARVDPRVRLIVTTNHGFRAMAENLGYIKQIEQAGGLVLGDVCFYLLHTRILGQAHGWRTLVTDSAKLANIIAGYGYNPVFRPTAVCIEAALTGRLAW